MIILSLAFVLLLLVFILVALFISKRIMLVLQISHKDDKIVFMILATIFITVTVIIGSYFILIP